MTQAEFDAAVARASKRVGRSLISKEKLPQKARIKAVAPVDRSPLEIMLQAQIEHALLPTPEYDVPYLVGRAHRLDVCWRSLKFGVECQGMPHRIKARFKADIEKRVLGQLQGWLIVEVDRTAIESGKAIEWIRELIKTR